MPKGNKLRCPECGYEYTQVNDEYAWCTGKKDADSIPHKVAKEMK